MNSIIWKGVSSTSINGLLISELPPITKPEMRVRETTIDGRDGSIIEELGYAPYDKNVLIGLHGNFNIDEIIKYFTGEGEVVFSNEPDKVYKAKICGRIDYTRLLRYRQASIPFKVQPYKYKLNEHLRETPIEAVSGTSIEFNKNAEDKAKALKIYGKSTQNGTPTPDAPADIVSLCEDGTIAVTVNGDTFDLTVDNGLKGIPVTDKSLATYTDASGQMWCADEIDFAKGVYVQRINTLIPQNAVRSYDNSAGTNRVVVVSADAIYTEGNVIGAVMCDCLPTETANNQYLSNKNSISIAYKNIAITINGVTTENAVIQWLIANPIKIQYALETPIEIPLTTDELSAYAKLYTNESNITVMNDENAYMMVEYFKPFEVFNEGFEESKPLMVLKGSGTVEISVNGIAKFSYTFPEGENEVYIDSEKEDAYLGNVLKNRNMNGEFPILIPKTNKIEWTGNIESISILPRSRWL